MNQFALHSKLPPNSKVAVLGAGLSGLTFSYFLNKLRPDLQLTVFEKTKRSGGWINTDSVKFPELAQPVNLEKGPRTLRGASDGTCIMMDIMMQLGHTKELMCIDSKSEANRKFVLDKNQALLQIPPTTFKSFWNFMSNSLSDGLIKGFLSEPSNPRRPADVKDESIYDFIKRRFGTANMADNLLSAIFHGIYAGDVKKLSANYTLKKLVELERDNGSLIKSMFKSSKQKENGNASQTSDVLKLYGEQSDSKNLQQILKKYPMVGFSNGLSSLPNALSDHLAKQENVEIKYGSTVESMSVKPNSKHNISVDGTQYEFDHLYASTVPKDLKISEDLTNFLKKITSMNVALVNVYHPTKDLIQKKYHGFGYLVPQATPNPSKLLGVIFDSVVEHNFNPIYDTGKSSKKELSYTKVTAMVGGHFFTNSPVPSESVILQQVKDCLGKHLGIDKKDLQDCKYQFTFAENSIPEYYVGYDASEIEKQVAKLGVSLGGMKFSRGPGLPDCVVKSFEVAKALA